MTVLLLSKSTTTAIYMYIIRKDYSQDCSVHFNLPIACQSTVHHQVLNMANYQEVDLQLAWLICPLAAQNKEKNACQ